jgi:hypothetical protein
VKAKQGSTSFLKKKQKTFGIKVFLVLFSKKNFFLHSARRSALMDDGCPLDYPKGSPRQAASLTRRAGR